MQEDIKSLHEAHKTSALSPDPSTKVGAVLVQKVRRFFTNFESLSEDEPLAITNSQVIARGFNTFPPQCDQHEEIYADRPRKYLRVVHAEVMAILSCGGFPATGSTLYTWPPASAPTCARCAAVVITAGIKRVCYVHQTNEFSERWAAELHEARLMYHEADVEITALRLSDDQIAEHFSVA